MLISVIYLLVLFLLESKLLRLLEHVFVRNFFFNSKVLENFLKTQKSSIEKFANISVYL